MYGSILLSDILNALDSTILAETYMTENDEYSLRSLLNNCFWERMNDYLRSFTENLTLAELISKCNGYLDEKWDLYMI